MSIGETTSARVCNASAAIAEQTAEFLARGGAINQIPAGQSGETIIPLNSKAGKKLSVERSKDRTERKAAKKQASAQARANNAAARARRDRLMPQVKALLAEGKSRREIAAIIDVTHGTINNWLKQEAGNE